MSRNLREDVAPTALAGARPGAVPLGIVVAPGRLD